MVIYKIIIWGYIFVQTIVYNDVNLFAQYNIQPNINRIVYDDIHIPLPFKPKHELNIEFIDEVFIYSTYKNSNNLYNINDKHELNIKFIPFGTFYKYNTIGNNNLKFPLLQYFMINENTFINGEVFTLLYYEDNSNNIQYIDTINNTCIIDLQLIIDEENNNAILFFYGTEYSIYINTDTDSMIYDDDNIILFKSNYRKKYNNTNEYIIYAIMKY